MKPLFLLLGLSIGWPFLYGSLYQPCANDLNPCGEPRVYFDLQLGAYRLNTPSFAFGEILGPTDFPNIGIASLIQVHDHTTGFYPRLAAGFTMDNGWCPCWVGNEFFLEIAVFYSCFDKNTERNETVGTFAIPRLDGGGDFLESFDPTIFSAIHLERGYRYGGAQFQLGSDMLFETPCSFLIPFVELDVDSVGQNYTLKIPTISAGSGGENARNYELKEFMNTVYYDFGMGLEFDYHFSPLCRSFFIFGQGTGFLSTAMTRLRGHESVITSPATVTSRITQKECVLSGKGRGQLGIGYQFGDNCSLSLTAQVDYWGYIPKIRNPHRVENGFEFPGVYDGPARIEKESTTNYALFLELIVAFF